MVNHLNNRIDLEEVASLTVTESHSLLVTHSLTVANNDDDDDDDGDGQRTNERTNEMNERTK